MVRVYILVAEDTAVTAPSPEAARSRFSGGVGTGCVSCKQRERAPCAHTARARARRPVLTVPRCPGCAAISVLRSPVLQQFHGSWLPIGLCFVEFSHAGRLSSILELELL